MAVQVNNLLFASQTIIAGSQQPVSPQIASWSMALQTTSSFTQSRMPALQGAGLQTFGLASAQTSGFLPAQGEQTFSASRALIGRLDAFQAAEAANRRAMQTSELVLKLLSLLGKQSQPGAPSSTPASTKPTATEQPVVTPQPVLPTPAASTQPASPGVGDQALEALERGGSVKIAFTKPLDKATYTGDKNGVGDVGGTLLMQTGSEYTVSYDPSTRNWTTSGFAEEVQKNVTFGGYQNLKDPLADDTMDLWGYGLQVKSDGSVFSKEYGEVGKIVSINGQSVNGQSA